MSGSLRYKDGAWRLTAHANGRRHYRTVNAPNNRTGKAEASKQLAALVTELDRGQHLGDHRTTLGDLAQAWLDHHGGSLEATTLDAYRADLHRAANLHDTPLRKLRPHHLDQLYRDLRTQGLAPKTIRNVHGTLHAALGHALRWEWIDRNPADAADPPVAKRKPIVVPEPEQVAAVIAAARPDFAAMVRTAATTGHRRSTLLGTRWNAVDLERGTATFGAGVTATTGKLHDKGTKADRTDRVTLGPATVAALRGHRTRCLETAVAAGCGLAADGYVWAQEPDGSRPWHPGGVGQRWRKACGRAGVDGIRFHDLKHFAVTQMLTAGVPPHVVAQRTGTSQQTILRVYSHFIPGADQEAAEVMDRLLG